MKDRIDYSEFVSLCRGSEKIELTDEEKERIIESRMVLEEILRANPEKLYYGINTGVGALLKKRIPKNKMEDFQENLIMSHSCGVGDCLEQELTKGMMLHMILGLKKGYSGVKLETLELLTNMFNMNLIPAVPEKGSLGASGDLVPQAHIALALISRGRIWYSGMKSPSGQILRAYGLKQAKLEVGEAIALLNGTSFMTSYLAFLVYRADNLIRLSKIAATLTSASLGKNKSLQSAYSLRCVPQIHEAFYSSLQRARKVVNEKINTFCGNPKISVNRKKILQSRGDFHGQPLSQAADDLSIAFSSLAGVSERRIERLLNPHYSGLAPFLAKNGGLNTGLMIAQYTAAALVSENKTLAHPASVDSIPVSAGQEDFVSMGAWAVRKCREICKNTEYVLAIEILCAAQAVDLKKDFGNSKVKKIHEIIRRRIPRLEKDRVISEDIERFYGFIHSGEFLKEIEVGKNN